MLADTDRAFSCCSTDKQQTSHKHDSSATSRSSDSPSPPPEPNDWIPSDKCNFCINGRLLTVNAQGELVAEITAHASTQNCSSNICNGIAVQQVPLSPSLSLYLTLPSYATLYCIIIF